jgi:hypothetical protein
MDSSTLLNRPRTTASITPKITKINSLALVSTQARKSSTKLVKVFEKGTYQKKTQLTVLNRYKKRLESIQKQNDRNFNKKRQVKLKLPDIKKYVGNFFTPGSTNDPLKAIGALAAFKSFQKGSKGDWGGALGSGLVAAGLLFGPSLLKGGINMMRGGGGAASGAAGSGGVGGVTPWWMKNTQSLSRSNQSYAKFIQGNSNIGDRARLVRRGMISPAGIFSRGGPEQVAKFGDASKVGKAFGRFGKAIIPGVGAAVGAIDATMRAKEGDITGASIAGTSATLDALAAGSAATGIGLPVAGLLSIASFGLDVVNLVRDLSGASEKEAQRNKANQPDRLKQQTEQQKALVEKKKEEGGKLTFKKTLNSYDKAVAKFEQFSKSFVPSTRAKSTYVEGREPLPPPPPPGQNLVADTQVVQDAIDFRNQFPLGRGTPNVSMTPHELHLRENTMLHAAGIGNDPTVERVHVEGSSHYSNRAIDIPVNSKPLGDRVAQFWRSRGYYVIWQVPDHYTHVHVQWNAGSPQAGAPTSPASTAGGTKGYIIVPGHASGGGAPGEKALVKRLAIDAYNKIKKQNPSAAVQYMDLDSMFEDTDAGWNKQKSWYENMERQGYQVLEIHMDQKGGIGKGVIRSHGQQSAVSNEWIRQGNYAYPKDWRSKPGEQPLAGPARGVDLFELGKMKDGTYTQRDIDALNAPFVSSVLSSVRGSVRQTTVPIATRLPYQQGYRASQPTVIPYPVMQQSRQPRQPQMMQASSSAPALMGGPSEEQLLNSFYKKVLLNTLL